MIRFVPLLAVLMLAQAAVPAAGPQEIQGMIWRGRQAIEAEEYDIAVRILEQAVKLSPSSADAHLQLARAHSGRKRLKPAEVHFKKALALRPGDEDALMGLAVIHEGTGDYDAAERNYRSALEARGSRKVERALASLLARTGRHPEAERRLQSLVRGDPGDTESRYELALSQSMRGACNLAIPLFEQVVAADPGKLTALFHLGNCLSRSGNEARARKVLEKFHAESEAERKRTNLEKEVHFMLLEADGQAQAGRMDQAEATARKAAGMAPDSFKAQAFLGSLLVELGKNGEALAFMRRASELRPGDAITLTEVGRLLAMSGQVREALGWFERAARASATLPDPHRFLAIIYQQMGRVDEAARERAIYRRLSGGG